MQLWVGQDPAIWDLMLCTLTHKTFSTPHGGGGPGAGPVGCKVPEMLPARSCGCKEDIFKFLTSEKHWPCKEFLRTFLVVVKALTISCRMAAMV